MNPWIIIATVGVMSFVLRSSLVFASRGREVPDSVVAVTRHISPAVMGAMLAASVVGSAGVSPEFAVRVAALAAGAFAAIRTRWLAGTLAAGFAVHVAGTAVLV
jgi:branched-subunit amino acid transport protein